MKLALSMKTAPTSTFLNLSDGTIDKELAIDTTFVLQPDPPEGAIDLQGLIILIRDLTEMRRLEAIENRRDRMSELGEMAAKVAHEIRNPLGGIKGFASLLERDLQDRPEQQQMAAYITEGTDNLNNLVTNVLNYSRPVKTQFESIDFVALCQELISYVQADVNTPKNIKLHCETKLTSLHLVIDPQLIKAALLNLIFNSIQAMPDGGSITLKLNSTVGKVNIEVTDTGVGIPPENIKKIFAPLFTTKPQGNGFGLSEVFKVIEAHNGTIDVSSTVGVGTTFKIVLPLRTKEAIS
jgi:signal transduction histidine kinase